MCIVPYSTLMLIGAHVSIAGGMVEGLKRGEAMKAAAIQTFASSPRTLKFEPLTKETIRIYREYRSHSPIQLHVFHAIYLVNLASEKPDYVRVSMDSLIHYQQLAGELGVYGTIFHVGSHKGNGFAQVQHQIGQAIAEILKESPTNTSLLIENAAGHSGTVGQTVEELAVLFDETEKAGGDLHQLGLCLDTQHAFASGVDATDAEKLALFTTAIDQAIGLSAVKVIHINDSKTEAGSHKDRHENVGVGLLGSRGLSHWLSHPAFQSLPFILEVPGTGGKGPAAEDIEAVWNLIRT